MSDLTDTTTGAAMAEQAEAEAVAAKIQSKITHLLAPMAAEMRIMEWDPEYQEIVWEAIGHEALKRSREAKKHANV